MNEFVEVIGVEHLKTILSGLTPEDIVKPAYDNWAGGIKTGHTILNLENGKVYGLGIELNQLPLADNIYIELYFQFSHTEYSCTWIFEYFSISLEQFPGVEHFFRFLLYIIKYPTKVVPIYSWLKYLKMPLFTILLLIFHI